VTRLLEGARGLADDATDLLRGQSACVEDVGQRHGPAEWLLDDEGDVHVGAHVKDPDESGILDARSSAGRVERCRGDGRRSGEADEDDLAVQGVVGGSPPLVMGSLGGA